MGSLLESWDFLFFFCRFRYPAVSRRLGIGQINARHHGPSGIDTSAFWTASSGLEGGVGVGIEGMLYIALSLD
jgi:hypothetical protein